LARFFVAHGEPAPNGLRIDCRVAVPLSSGLGSSASAALAGILAANALLGEPADRDEVLRLAAEVEGHPDNVAAALFGGLVMVARHGDRLLTRRVEIPPLSVALAVPELDVSTSALRAELPSTVSRADAVFNLGRTALVVRALQDGDLELLGLVMEDKLHQSHRLAHIPGGEQAMAAARAAGAAAVALSGSGPSLIAFVSAGTSAADVAAAMTAALGETGVPARPLVLTTSAHGARVEG
jgi:homoserine kinase